MPSWKSIHPTQPRTHTPSTGSADQTTGDTKGTPPPSSVIGSGVGGAVTQTLFSSDGTTGVARSIARPGSTAGPRTTAITVRTLNPGDGPADVRRYVHGKLESYLRRSSTWHLLHRDVQRRLLAKAPKLARRLEASRTDVESWIKSAIEDVQRDCAQVARKLHKPGTGARAEKPKASEPWPLLGEGPQSRSEQLTRARALYPDDARGDDALVARYHADVLARLTPAATEATGELIDAGKAYERAVEKTRGPWSAFRRYESAHPGLDRAQLSRCFDRAVASMRPTAKLKEAIHTLETDGHPTLLRQAAALRDARSAEDAMVQNFIDDFVANRFGEVPGDPAHADAQARFAGRLRQIAEAARTKGGLELSAGESVATILAASSNVDRRTWVQEKLREALRIMPLALTRAGGFRALLRTTAGVALERLHALPADITPEERDRELFRAIQMGFYFGVAYAFIDGAQDELRDFPGLSGKKLNALFDAMEKGLAGAPVSKKDLPDLEIAHLLHEAFEGLRTLTGDRQPEVFEEILVLLKAQRDDEKSPDKKYSEEALYLPLIMKAERSYSSVVAMSGHDVEAMRDSLIMHAFRGQMTDDLRDFFVDRESGNVTAFTDYAAHKDGHPPPANPLLRMIKLSQYLSDKSGGDERLEAFLGRRLGLGLRSIEQSHGTAKLDEFISTFAGGDRELAALLKEVPKRMAGHTDTEGAALGTVSARATDWARTNRSLKTYFMDHLPEVEKLIPIAKAGDAEEQLLVRGMNHSLMGGGKRMRPMLAFMTADMLGLPLQHVHSIARAIEHLHTSSLIFDDLPAQDDAALRRGRATLHTLADDVPREIAEARAQLAAVALISTAVGDIAGELPKYCPPERTARVINYVANAMKDLCVGQMKDIYGAKVKLPEAGGDTEKERALRSLEEISRLKTGKAIEISLIAPALVAGIEDPAELRKLETFATKLGILFQLKDDILDVEGDAAELGKNPNIDAENNTQTFVSVLGLDGAKSRLASLRLETLEALDALPFPSGTLRELVDYVVKRTK